MSTFAHRKVICPACGNAFAAKVFSSVSAMRMPDCPQWVLEGTLNRPKCTGCGTHVQVEQPLLFIDLDRGLWVHCLPQVERATWWAHEATARQSFATSTTPPTAPPIAAEMAAKARPQVVFGFEELREKVVAAIAALDFSLVECLKFQLLAGTGIMAEKNARGLALKAVEDDHLVFSILYVADGPAPGRVLDAIRVPMAVYDEVQDKRADFERTYPPLFGDGYINIMRYAIEKPEEAQAS